MFHDPHGKVFSVFMETLVDLVVVHHEDLIDWLYILLTRLLSKTGADLLASIHAKVQRALEVVRWSLLCYISLHLFFCQKTWTSDYVISIFKRDNWWKRVFEILLLILCVVSINVLFGCVKECIFKQQSIQFALKIFNWSDAVTKYKSEFHI